MVITNGETSRTILARFDPTIDETKNTPTDASKLAGGNRHGNHTEQRVTLDLADDYYKIASEATYNYSKFETGKDLETHKDVNMWHYFVNDIYFVEDGETELIPYSVTINVKEKNDGDYVYSFSAEKESSIRQTLHAAVNTRKGANGELFIDSIPQTPEKSTPSAKKDEATLPEGARAALQIEYEDYDKPITSKDRSNLRTIEKKSINKFTHDDLVKTRKWAYRYYKDKNIGVKSPFFRAWFGEWRAYDKKTAAETIDIPQGVKIDTSNRKITNKDTKWQIQITEDTIQDSLHYAQKDRLYIQRILSHIDEIIEKAIFLDTQISSKNKSNKKGSSEFMHYLYAIVEFQGAPFLAKITVEEYDAGTSHRAYNAQRIKMSALSRAQYSQLKTAYRGKYASSVDAISIADLINLVNTYDDKFTPAPEISPEAAKLLLNKDGTPKVFYHGTRKENGEFWEFDYNKAKKKGGLGFKSLGVGNYFTSNKLDGTELYGSRVIDAYLSIKKPLVVKHGSDFKNEVSRAININALQMTYPRIQQEMRAAGYDGVVLLNENSEVAIAVTFDSEQIKSATDNIGTFDGSNPDIRYSLDISQNNGKKFALPEGFNTKAIKAKGVPTTTERPANISQIVANNTRNKVYSRGAALSVVNQLSGIKGLTLGERDELVSAVWTGLQIALTNAQAGIEKIGKKFGIKDIETRVQTARAAMNQAQEMIGSQEIIYYLKNKINSKIYCKIHENLLYYIG